MSAITKTVRGEHSIHTGISTEYIIDLAKQQGYPGGPIVADVLGYSLASVTVSCTAATGTSGTAPIKQANEKSGVKFDLAAPKTVTFSENTESGAFDITISGQYLILDLSAIVFGSVGKIVVKIIAKR